MTETAVSKRSESLWDLEETLLALIDSEDGVTPEQEEEYRADLAKSFAATIQKRNSHAGFWRWLESSIATCKAETERIQKRKHRLEKALEREKAYLLWTLQRMEKKSVECDIATFYRKDNPAKVEFTDEGKTGCDVPAKFKTLSITVPAEAWEAHVRDYCALRREFYKCPDAYVMPFLDDITKTDVSIDKTAIKKAIQAGESVSGADLAIGAERIEVR